MEKIASFTIDHIRMSRGVFVSRIDRFGETILTTFDIRLKEPNREPVVDIPTLHTMEHLGATFFRSHELWQNRTVYFGPMGCRTGLYAVMEGQLDSKTFLPAIRELFDWMRKYNEAIPGAAAAECGNWLDHNLGMARWEADKFYREVLENPAPANLNYPG